MGKDKKCAWLALNDACADRPVFCGPGLACKDGKCLSTAPLPPDPTPPTPPLEHNIDRPGNDYYSTDLPSAKPEQCEALCKGDNRCRAFTYVKPGFHQGPRPRCWLKSAIPVRIVANTCCVSGTVARVRAKQAGIFKEAIAPSFKGVFVGGQ